MNLAQRDQILSQLCAQRWPYQSLLDALNFPPTASVLDIGAGSGELLALLRERGHTGELVSLDTLAAPGVLVGDAHTLPFASSRFDAVILLRVLAHLAQPQQALAEAQRVLKSGGLLVVAAHGPGHLAAFWGQIGKADVPPLLQGFERQTVRLPVVMTAQAAQALAVAYGLSQWPKPPFADSLELELFSFRV